MNSQNIKTSQIKSWEDTETTHEFREDFDKLQSETKGTIKKRDIWNKIAQDMKDEFNKDMENFRKKNQTEILEIKCSLNQNLKYSWKKNPYTLLVGIGVVQPLGKQYRGSLKN
jgi:DNA-directed RNA polymerase alpha subunit